jgi:hypothetical protein
VLGGLAHNCFTAPKKAAVPLPAEKFRNTASVLGKSTSSCRTTECRRVRGWSDGLIIKRWREMPRERLSEA